MTDKCNIVAGITGFLASVGLMELSLVASICAGFATTIYMVVSIYFKVRNKGK